MSKKLTVLVAEDHPVNLKMIRFMLEKLDCKVYGAENGLEAVALFRETQPDLVLMDIQMPEMDGFDATREIRKIEEEKKLDRVVISALSANDSPADRQLAEKAGMDFFTSKPVKMESIAELLGKAFAPSGERKEPSGPFDYEAILEIFGGDDKIVKTLLKEFVEGSAELLGRIRRYEAEEKYDSLESAAHSLKGQLLNLHARKASEYCAILEKTALKGDKKAIEDACRNCNDSMAVLVDSIKGYLTI